MKQMRQIKEERLGAVDMSPDFTEAREKLADDNQFIKARDPEPSGDHPN